MTCPNQTNRVSRDIETISALRSLRRRNKDARQPASVPGHDEDTATLHSPNPSHQERQKRSKKKTVYLGVHDKFWALEHACSRHTNIITILAGYLACTSSPLGGYQVSSPRWSSLVVSESMCNDVYICAAAGYHVQTCP
jgi:hypothetical protein